MPTIPVEMQPLARLLLLLVPVDCQHTAELTTEVEGNRVSYRLSLRLEWEKEVKSGPPWVVPFVDNDWITELEKASNKTAAELLTLNSERE